MDGKTRTLLIGNNEDAKYHPLERVQEEIISILEKQVNLICTDDYQVLSYEVLSEYKVCIMYVDYSKRRISDEQMAGILQYTSTGGRLLVIHNGISFQERHEYAQMVGAKFLKHPPYQEMNFHVVCPDHPIMKGIEDFQMEEEPYRFDMDPFNEMTLLLEYEMEGTHYPAAWTQSYGLGTIVYLMPGHNRKSFQHSTYREMISNSIEWLVG